MSMAYIRKFYDVPAKRGAAILWRGLPRVIVGSKGSYLRVRGTETEYDIIYTIHPTCQVEYLPNTTGGKL